MRRFPARRILVLTVVGAAGLLWFGTGHSEAATFPLVRDYLNRQEANLTNGLVHQVFFTAATNLPGLANQVIMTFPDGNDGSWCRTPGIDLSVSGLSDPAGATEAATVLPGTLAATCTQGSGGGSFDQITITGVGPINAGTKYGLEVTDGTIGKLGTPAAAVDISITLATNNGAIDIDTGLIHTAIITSDAVSISAVVAVTPPAANPVVEFRGRASPSASLSISRDGVSIDSSTMGTDATFDRLLSDQPVGQHVYELFAVDTDGRSHPTMTIATSLAAGSTTVISGIFFGPTIEANSSQLTVGDQLTLIGLTVPNSTVATGLEPSGQSYTTTASASGRWTRVIDTTDLPIGTYSATAAAVASDTAVSEESAAVSFAVVAAPTTPTTNQNTPVDACISRTTSDVNCDSKVNLTDFSIMLFYWNQRVGPGNRSDMNHDGIINIVDFSILLYQWTGF